MGALIGLVVLVLDVLAVIEIAKSAFSTGAEVLWIVLVLALPVIGLAAYFFVGRTSAAGGAA